MRSGVRLGLDVGSVRIGVARTDPLPMLAVPVETIAMPPNGDLLMPIERVLSLIAEFDAMEILVGHPINLKGHHTASTARSEEFASLLATRLPHFSVRLIDERLSSVSASNALTSAGLNTRKQRGIIDQQAAVVLLQHAIDLEKASGRPPGIELPDSL